MDLETAPLLANRNAEESERTTSTHNPPTEHARGRLIREEHINRVLPVAFTASFAIAATSATTVFAYAHLMCKDPANCDEQERKPYAGVVAVATSIANVCGVLSVGLLRQWNTANPKFGLFFWLTCRGTSLLFLVAGLMLDSIYVAVAGRVFEGFATDNVLHYTLGAVYVKSEEPAMVARRFGTSLALYMSAMSMSPTIVTLLPDFGWSFGLAIAILGISLIYVALYVPTVDCATGRISDQQQFQHSLKAWSQRTKSILKSSRTFVRGPFTILPGMAIFLYNAAQAYLFPAIMVHASIRFGFTGTENGYLISIAALTSAIYLFAIMFAVPKCTKRFKTRPQQREDSDRDTTGARSDERSLTRRKSDALYALTSMLVQVIVLPCIKLAGRPHELYGLVVLIALGLSAPSFIKSYAVTSTKAKDSALAGMAIMESLGGLVSPMVLGAIQSFTNEGMVFIVASCLVAGAMLCLVASLLYR
ncbi:unnamed protein product [Periconia digitata]|uniref:Uncharacterized protein n=1 Tax=Periconia digitata TaxID=1303443 RepID=A0A9W4UFB8_9PLEO|nr:unnamed protein product [Periconia digitata]